MSDSKILEKDVEGAFLGFIVDNLDRYEIIDWQLSLPIGILDVLTYSKCDFAPMVVEIKRGAANEKAISQVLCYAKEVEYLLSRFLFSRFGVLNSFHISVIPAIVARSISGKMAERAFETGVVRFIEYKQVPGGISFLEHSSPYLGDDSLFENDVSLPVFYEMMEDILTDQSYGKVIPTYGDIDRRDFFRKVSYDQFSRFTKELRWKS